MRSTKFYFRRTVSIMLMGLAVPAFFYAFLRMLSPGEDVVGQLAGSFLLLLGSAIAWMVGVAIFNGGLQVSSSSAGDDDGPAASGNEFNWLIKGTPEYVNFHGTVD